MKGYQMDPSKLVKLQDMIYKPGVGFDSKYQDIECLKFIGYIPSHKSWKIIKPLVKWKEKLVYDMSCFNGYFLFKTIDEGAHPFSVGFDRAIPALKVCELINQIRGGEALFSFWKAGDDIPNPVPHIMLCLNCLHHYKEQKEPFLQKIRAKECIIFEINNDQIPLIEKYFIVKETHKSPRVKRSILKVKNK